MKKIFLFASLVFVFLIFFVFPKGAVLAYNQLPNASTGDSYIWSLSIEETTATASGTVAHTGADETAGGVGFAFATDADFETAVATSSKFDGSGTDYVTSTDFSWEISAGGTACVGTCTLTKGTLYYYRAYATNTIGTGYDGTNTLLTKPDEPATSTFAVADALEDRIKLTWTAGTGAEKTMVRYNDGTTYPTSISDGEQAYWGTGAEVTLFDLPAEHTYYFRAWSSTSDGGLTTTSDSYASALSKTTAVSGGGRSFTAPTTYADSLVINQGAAAIQTREATLKLKAGNASYMSISNDNLFLGPLEAYAATKTWTLTEGDGVKTVYVKFLSPDGLNSDVISATITLETPVLTLVPEEVVEEAPIEEIPVVETPVIEEAPVVEKPISEMTIDELKVKIAEILAQVEILQNQLTELETAAVFEVNLKYGDKGDDVAKLQEVLIEEGLLEKELNTGWFGPLTKTAVIKFQEKYASDVLAAWGLTKGTGMVGSTTRDKLNELLGK